MAARIFYLLGRQLKIHQNNGLCGSTERSKAARCPDTPVEMAKSLGFKCLDQKLGFLNADFRKVKIKIVDCLVSETPTHKFWGKI